MPEIIIWSLIFVITLVTLIISADFFIKSSERVGLALKVPPFIIGVTLIAIGTSLPELITSIIAVTSSTSNSDIVLGNVVGSNITNICLVLGVVSLLGGKIQLKFDILKVDMPMLLGAAFLLYLMVWNQRFTLFEGIICITGAVFYLAYIFKTAKSNKESLVETSEEEASSFNWKEALILVGSGLVIYFSADFNVQAIVKLSQILKIGKEFIALTAVSLGTSLPELVVSIVAVRTGNGEMAVGNILGSNIFNVFAVMGIPRLFGIIEIPPTILDFSLPAMLVASLIFFFIVLDKIVSRWEGLVLLLLYALFIGNLIGQNV